MEPEEDWSDKTEEYPAGIAEDLDPEGETLRPPIWDWSKVIHDDDDGEY